MDCSQITGAASSYARKYALNALLMIDDSKDSDDDSLSPKNPKNAEEKPTEKPAAKPVAKAEVTTTSRVPSGNPVKDFIANELVFMGQMYGITDKTEMLKKFGEMRKGLISAKIIEDIPSDQQTMEQAQAMVDAIYKNFKPSGEVA
jgi:hypothetical protein